MQSGRSRFEEACKALRLTVDPKMLVGRLAGEQATLLALALACVRVSAVIILDDLDRDVSAATQQRMLDALIRLAKATGPTIIVTTTDRSGDGRRCRPGPHTQDGAAFWELDPRERATEVLSRELGGYGGIAVGGRAGDRGRGPGSGTGPRPARRRPERWRRPSRRRPRYDGRWSRER